MAWPLYLRTMVYLIARILFRNINPVLRYQQRLPPRHGQCAYILVFWTYIPIVLLLYSLLLPHTLFFKTPAKNILLSAYCLHWSHIQLFLKIRSEYSSVLFSTLNQNGLLCWIWAANNYKNYCNCRVNVRKVVSFLAFKASAIKIILVLQTTFFMTPIWLQICAKPKWATQRIQIISEEKFLHAPVFLLILNLPILFSLIFFDMDKKKKSRENAGAKNALSEI